MSRLRVVIAEVHRRSLWQVLGLYLASSWVGYQLIRALTERFGLPDWVPAFAIAFFIIGLPVVLVTAFIQHGLVRRSRAADPAAPRPADHALFTWDRALLAGVVAFVLLGVSAGSYMGLRSAGIGRFGSLIAAGELSTRESVVIAELQSAAGDSLLARALTDALRVQLDQSPAIQVVDAARIRDVLARMGRVTERLTPAVAREIAVRDRVGVIIEGDVAVSGGALLLTARLLRGADGAVLATARETVRDSARIVSGVDRLARKLREKIGESLRTIRADQPLEVVLTGSPAALLRYSQAVRALDVQADYPVAIALLEQAVTLDSTFALAWRRLALAYGNSGMSREKSVQAAMRAYQHRNRLTERERGLAAAYYHGQVEGDNDRGIATYRTLLGRHPDDVAALNNLGLAYWTERENVRARESFSRALELDSASIVAWSNLIEAHVKLGEMEQAERVAAHFAQRFGDRPAVLNVRYFLAAALGRYDDAERLAQALVESRQGGLVWRTRANSALSDLAMLRGQLARAEHYRAEARRANEERGRQGAILFAEAVMARMDLVVRADTARALHRLADALARQPFATVYRMDRPYLLYALIFARARQAGRTRALLDEYEREAPPELRGDDLFDRTLVQGHLALADGDAAGALNAFRAADRATGCAICALPHIAEAHDRLGQRDSVIATYERYIGTPETRRPWTDNFFLPRAHERLAELYQSKGERAKAASHAARFIELWHDADAELQPRVRAKRELLSSRDRRGRSR